ncbi:MAG: hypothetical protein WC549_02920 [Actinomycetota bacterium]
MPVIHSDGARYYSYLISYILLEDLTFNEYIEAYTNKANIRGFVYYDDTGNYLPTQTIGVAIMALPFFLSAYLLSMIFNYSLDGISILFQHAYGLSGIFYGFLGIIFLVKILKKFFNEKIIILSIIAIIFGTNLFHYLTFDSGFSHSFSFFLFVLFCYATIRWHENPRSYKYSIFLGLILGFITLVRLTNIIAVFILLFYGVYDLKSLRKKILFFKQNLSRIIAIIISSILSFLPQMIIWKIGSGRWIINPYQDEKLLAFPGHIIEVLFSVRAGLLFWSPMLVFSITGFYYLKKKDNGLFFPVLIFSVLNLLIIAGTRRWWYGASFGHRGFVESYSLLIFPVASFFSAIRLKKIKIIVLIFGILFICYSFLQMYFFWEAKILADNVDFQFYIDKFINLYNDFIKLF